MPGEHWHHTVSLLEWLELIPLVSWSTFESPWRVQIFLVCKHVINQVAVLKLTRVPSNVTQFQIVPRVGESPAQSFKKIIP